MEGVGVKFWQIITTRWSRSIEFLRRRYIFVLKGRKMGKFWLSSKGRMKFDMSAYRWLMVLLVFVQATSFFGLFISHQFWGKSDQRFWSLFKTYFEIHLSVFHRIKKSRKNPKTPIVVTLFIFWISLFSFYFVFGRTLFRWWMNTVMGTNAFNSCFLLFSGKPPDPLCCFATNRPPDKSSEWRKE